MIARQSHDSVRPEYLELPAFESLLRDFPDFPLKWDESQLHFGPISVLHEACVANPEWTVDRFRTEIPKLSNGVLIDQQNRSRPFDAYFDGRGAHIADKSG